VAAVVAVVVVVVMVVVVVVVVSVAVVVVMTHLVELIDSVWETVMVERVALTANRVHPRHRVAVTFWHALQNGRVLLLKARPVFVGVDVLRSVGCAVYGASGGLVVMMVMGW
jgi:hypothetical protein